MEEIKSPSNEEVEKAIDNWNSNERYVKQDKALHKLFHETYPNNTDISEVLVKCSVLNDFYNTSIFSVAPVAEHIVDANIDNDLKERDPNIVDKIANVDFNGKKRRLYSFATKYCNMHYPEDYPIYDENVKNSLKYFKNKDKFDKFTLNKLEDYKELKRILLNFKEYYHIEKFTFKELDEYLWQIGSKIK